MITDMRWNWLLAAIVVLCAVILVSAWADGGREPVRDIAQSIPVPEMPQ